MPGASRCTAFAIAPDRAVTAAHCLYSARLGGFVPADSVHILLGYGRGAFAQHLRVVSYAVAPGWAPGPAPSGPDVAVLRLAPQAPPAYTLRLSDRPVSPGAALMMGGYEQDRAEVLLADTACTLRGVAPGPMLVHDCAGTRGSSGAPVLARGPDGAWEAVGVQATGILGADGGTAVPVTALRPLLGP